MSCVLRAWGRALDVDRFRTESSLCPCRVYRKGDPAPGSSRRSPPRIREDSGIVIDVSGADFDDLPRQIEDAIHFLEHHRSALLHLQHFPGVEEACLDFGLARHDVAAQYMHLPATLIRLAAEFGLSIELSIYTASPGDAATG
jgi:hypothetical protein